MERIPLPSRIEFKKGDEDNQSILTVEPCFPGYSITLGNALRRVLLSSLPGAAVTSFKVKGVDHEFSTIPEVKEDLVEIILNLKKLRFKVFTDQPVKIRLKANGEKKVTGKDIEPNSDMEVVTKDFPIATLTSPKADLDMELTIKRGRGYETTEERGKEDKERLEVGEIAIDAIFTPVHKVAFDTEMVRVGQMTNYERLVLNITTDGTITPEQALGGAIEIILAHFNLLEGFGEKIEEPVSESEEVEAETEIEVKEEETDEEAKPKKKRGRPKKEDNEE
ncbi:MAG: DNA-directed RNA polymerase subunit alpha [bacterium]